MKNFISYGECIVWNLLEPSAVSARDYAKKTKKSHALRNLNFSAQMGRPQIDSDFNRLQSWTKMLRKMHVVYVILEYFPLKPGSLKIFPPPPKKAMLKCGPNIFAAY